MTANTVKNGNRFLSDVKSHGQRLTFFSDEDWIVDRAYNAQNDRLLANKSCIVHHVYKTKLLASIMTLGVICSNGKTMPLSFFQPKESDEPKRSCDVPANLIISCMEVEAQVFPCIFEQDSEHVRMGKKMMKPQKSTKYRISSIRTAQ